MQYNTMQYHKETKYTIWYNDMQGNTMQYYKIAYDIYFRPKQSIIDPKEGHFGPSVPENGPPSSRMGTYRKTEGIQSYLRTWESDDPIKSSPSEAKKMGHMGVA